MKYILSDSGLKILESFSFTQTLFAFDFDGTLSKIVPSPDDAYMSETTCDLIKKLSKRASVAIISGRSLSDLKSRLSFTPTYAIGNHGLEGPGKSENTAAKAANTCKKWKRQISVTLKSHLHGNGLSIEDKTFSLALHYRKSNQKRKIKLLILKAISHIQPPPRMILGKCVINLVPIGGPHKGMALVDLMLRSNLRSAFYIGDDDTDEDVFALSNMRILGIRVGRKRGSQAKYFIDRQSEINKLLRNLLSFYDNEMNACG